VASHRSAICRCVAILQRHAERWDLVRECSVTGSDRGRVSRQCPARAKNTPRFSVTAEAKSRSVISSNSRRLQDAGIGFQDHRHRPLGHPSAVKNPARIPRRIICGFQLLAVIDESPGAQHRHLHGDQELVVAAFQAVQRSPLHGGDARLRPSRPRYPTKLTHHS
jgi:hypothetical protein